MKKLLVLLTAALGALAFWRRKTLKEDAARVASAGKDAAQGVSAKIRPAADEGSAPDGNGLAETVTEAVAEVDDSVKGASKPA